MPIIVSDGDVFAVPEFFATTPSQLRWLTQERFTGYNPVMDELATIAWHRYSSIKPDSVSIKTKRRLNSIWHRFLWDHPYIFSFILKINRRLVGKPFKET